MKTLPLNAGQMESPPLRSSLCRDTIRGSEPDESARRGRRRSAVLESLARLLVLFGTNRSSMKMNDLAELAECFRYLTEESHQSSFLSIFDASLKAVPSVSEARRDTQLVLSSDIPNYRMRQILLRLLRKVREGNQELLQLTGLYRSLFCSHQSEGEKQVTSVVCSIERELTPPLESRRRIRAGKILFQEGVTSSRVDLKKCYARWCDVPGE